MVRTKRAAKFYNRKKYKKSTLDSTPWEELSKNIKGKFSSEIKIEDENENNKQSEDCTNIETIKKFDCEKAIVDDHKSNLKKKRKPGKKQKALSAFQTAKVDNENRQNDIFEKKSSIENDCVSPHSNNGEVSPANKFKGQTNKLKKKEEMSQSLGEKSNAAMKWETKKKSKKWKMERNKLFEKKRIERRKELGIMQLPKKFENRLLRIRKVLRKKNLAPEEIKNIMRKERSKAQDEFRKSHQAAQICFNCRKSGHLVANCPLNEENNDQSICLKCGSTDHKYSMCQKEVIGFPYATCFICKEQGHITRDCPNNEHGIYPKGGKCNLCDSVNHLRKNCPTLEIKKEKSSITLHTIDNCTSIDDEVMDIEQSPQVMKSEKPKVVKF